MVIEVDPGIEAENVEEGATIPLASTQPNVNPDEFLAALDADTQAFLKLLLAGGAEALDPEQGRGRKLSAALRQFEPLRARHRQDQRRPGRSAARASAARSTTSACSPTSSADNDEDRDRFVDSSNAVLAALRQPGGLDPASPAGAARAP